MMSPFHRYEFRAMGCDVSVVASADENRGQFISEARRARDVFERLESTFSRFRSDSELSRVNLSAGEPVETSADFSAVLEIALEGARVTGGLFDPTILEALELAGYDRDFDSVRPRPVGPAEGSPSGRWAEVSLAGHTVECPAGVGLDFGGVAKGWSVDRAAETIDGLRWVVVNAGGDLRVRGDVGDELSVGVGDPFSGNELTRLRLSEGAIATSSVTRRTWGEGLHHIIDPRTGRPALVEVLQATAWSETCAGAEIAAKWLLLGGPEVLSQVPGLVVLDGGDIETNIEGLEVGSVA
jgi:FAD:protein FMN transferase